MKAINFLPCMLTALFLSCSTDDQTNQDPGSFQPFVRFNAQVDPNGKIITYPRVEGGAAVSTLENNAIKSLKIPVAYSAQSYEEPLEVAYTFSATAGEDLISLSPERLTFSQNKVVDTLVVSFSKRWETTDGSITIKLTEASDPQVNIGISNSINPLDQLTIELGEIYTIYGFDTNSLELNGQSGEKKRFRLNFLNGYLRSEVESMDLFERLDGFAYTLEPVQFGDDYIEYELTLDESLENDDVEFQSIISLAESPNYEVSGNSDLFIKKPSKAKRDLATNPAANFYDTSNPYYLVRGENWIDHNNNGECSWRSWTAFAVPVVVEAGNDNAILGSDNGTPDPADDIYYDAFKIGFVSPLAGRTTNPFNLKRWFDNEDADADVSPGFNIEAAIEFFPEGGTSTTQGTVAVITQPLSISSKDGKVYSFIISGGGTYRQVNDDLWEIKLELRVKNDELYGGTITSDYYIYSDRGYEDPQDLPGNSCVDEKVL